MLKLPYRGKTCENKIKTPAHTRMRLTGGRRVFVTGERGGNQESLSRTAASRALVLQLRVSRNAMYCVTELTMNNVQ